MLQVLLPNRIYYKLYQYRLFPDRLIVLLFLGAFNNLLYTLQVDMLSLIVEGAARVLSVLVAMMLWLYVVENNDEDTTKTYRDIGIQIQGLDTLRENGMTIIDGADTTVDVTVIGKWDALSMCGRTNS